MRCAIDAVRRREVKLHEELRHSRYALLENPANLTEKQRLKFAQIAGANLEVGRAWQARQNFTGAFENVTLQESEAIYQQWHEGVVESGIKEVIKVAQMFASHLPGVLEAMTSGWSNARAECQSRKTQRQNTTPQNGRQRLQAVPKLPQRHSFLLWKTRPLSTKLPVEPKRKISHSDNQLNLAHQALL